MVAKAAPRRTILTNEVLEQAARLFSEKGFEATSLQDIASAVGLSRPALYYYFKNKSAFLEALIEDVTVNAAGLLDPVQKHGGSASERLRLAVQTMVLWVLDRTTRFKVTDRAEPQLPQRLARRHEAAKRKVLEVISGIVADGVENGEFREVDRRVAALSIIGMCNWTAWWFRDDRSLTKEEVAGMIAELALNAVRRERRGETGIEGAIQSLREDLDRLERLLAATKAAAGGG